jgi:hypothetical protein
VTSVCRVDSTAERQQSSAENVTVPQSSQRGRDTSPSHMSERLRYPGRLQDFRLARRAAGRQSIEALATDLSGGD